MNILFNTSKVKYEDGEYIEVPEENDNDEIIYEDVGKDFNPYEENEIQEELQEKDKEKDKYKKRQKENTSFLTLNIRD